MRVDHIVRNVLVKFDHDGNGVIDLPTGGARAGATGAADERFRLAKIKHAPGYQRTIDLRDLFAAANTNGDRFVTSDELRNLVSKFDRDGDGALDEGNLFAKMTSLTEFQQFTRKFGMHLGW